jgi:hypothetical protein
MYRIVSTNVWCNGQQFASLVAAKEYADKFGDVCIMDVVRDIDRDYFQLVYTGGSIFQKGIKGKYRKEKQQVRSKEKTDRIFRTFGRKRIQNES